MTILVIGASGKTGRRVAERLEARGLPVRRASRTAAIPFDQPTDRTPSRPSTLAISCGSVKIVVVPCGMMKTLGVASSTKAIGPCFISAAGYPSAWM